jgi:hypothetical protein
MMKIDTVVDIALSSHGQWDGNTYIDINVMMADKETAMKLAAKYNQMSIFNLETFEETLTGGDGKPIENLPAPLAGILISGRRQVQRWLVCKDPNLLARLRNNPPAAGRCILVTAVCRPGTGRMKRMDLDDTF